MNSGLHYQLYWEAQSGAIAPEMLLGELGVSFEIVPVDMARGEHLTTAYRALNPTGQVPALRLPEGTVVGESAAIVLVLGERHPESSLIPGPTDADRPQFLYWLLFMATSMYMAFVRSNHPERFTCDESGLEPVREAALNAIERQFAIIDDAMGASPFFLERGFSALDMYLSMLTIWHPDRDGLFARRPNVSSAVGATIARPVCRRVLTTHRCAP